MGNEEPTPSSAVPEEAEECGGNCCGGCADSADEVVELSDIKVEGAVISGMLNMLASLTIASRARALEVVTALAVPKLPGLERRLAEDAHWRSLLEAGSGDE
jgi:hypothetical protein